MIKYRRAMSIGEVRQDVKTSAGSSGDEGSCSFGPQAASWRESVKGCTPSGNSPCAALASWSRRRAKVLKLLSRLPAAEQSQM